MSEIKDENVPHEAAHAEMVDDQMERTSDQTAIADVGAPGVTYAQAEAQATVTAVNSILKVLRDAELIPLT